MITICIPCGYIYDGELKFESLAQDWSCPDCGAGIDCFDIINDSSPDESNINNDPTVMALGKSGKT